MGNIVAPPIFIFEYITIFTRYNIEQTPYDSYQNVLNKILLTLFCFTDGVGSLTNDTAINYYNIGNTVLAT